MVKVFWISDLVAPTGFARVSHSIIKYLPKDKFDIVGMGVNYFGDPHEYKFPIYPAKQHPQDIYGLLRLDSLLDFVRPDIIFIINDAWIQFEYLRVIKEHYKDKKLPKIVTYTPVDAEDHDADWYAHFDVVTAPVAYTKFGADVIEKATDNKISPKIISHGVDRKDFFRIPGGKNSIRRKLFGNSGNDNKFIVLNANRNQPRKRLDITLKGFAKFAVEKDDVKLYTHCGVTDSHIDIVKMSNRLGIEDKLILTSLNSGIQRVPTELLNEIYNACDVGLNTGLGEGFGLVNAEHAVTGAPQIVGNFSATGPLYKDIGIVLDPLTEWTIDRAGTTGKVVSEYDVADALDKLYTDREFLNKLSEKSIKKFSSKAFSWKYIALQWSELFESIL
jgi:glycosyltransferase involved in cell wall biosynthesis